MLIDFTIRSGIQFIGQLLTRFSFIRRGHNQRYFELMFVNNKTLEVSLFALVNVLTFALLYAPQLYLLGFLQSIFIFRAFLFEFFDFLNLLRYVTSFMFSV